MARRQTRRDPGLQFQGGVGKKKDMQHIRGSAQVGREQIKYFLLVSQRNILQGWRENFRPCKDMIIKTKPFNTW